MGREETAESAVVMGLGRFGGGLGAVSYLLERGMEVTVTDLQTEEQLHDSLLQLRDLRHASRIRLVLGTHEGVDFENADLVVAN
ncbi:MAG: UDP-N-acetylmuramoyl-L-alanine--D-glutamate ligase, partial [Planctomycetota bacterium]|nr:UDP-N-acetylmuramoyl-L-alanine--D-glutamate ligase [Planctomycetota bacterium]